MLWQHCDNVLVLSCKHSFKTFCERNFVNTCAGSVNIMGNISLEHCANIFSAFWPMIKTCSYNVVKTLWQCLGFLLRKHPFKSFCEGNFMRMCAGRVHITGNLSLEHCANILPMFWSMIKICSHSIVKTLWECFGALSCKHSF